MGASGFGVAPVNGIVINVLVVEIMFLWNTLNFLGRRDGATEYLILHSH